MTTTMLVTIKPAEQLGAVLVSRGRAAAMREEIERVVDAGDDVLVDLDGVNMVSPSFADELFGKLRVQVAAGSVRFARIPAGIEPLIRFVQVGRTPA